MLLPTSWPGKWFARMALTLGLLANGKTFNPPELVMTTVLGHEAATDSTSSLPSQSTSKVVRSKPSVAHVLRKTRQTSGGVGWMMEL